MSSNKARIFIAYTGGTVGMKKTANGYQPIPGYLQHLMAHIPQFQAEAIPHYDIYQFQPLLDSAIPPFNTVRREGLVRWERYIPAFPRYFVSSVGGPEIQPSDARNLSVAKTVSL